MADDNIAQATPESNQTSSGAFSFQDWKFGIWLSKNKNTLKMIFLGTASVLAIVQQKDNLSPLRIAITGVAIAVCKLAVDALDYWVSENPQ